MQHRILHLSLSLLFICCAPLFVASCTGTEPVDGAQAIDGDENQSDGDHTDSLASTCVGDNPQGCVDGSCAYGFVCETTEDCLSSSCACNEETAEWVCDSDCSGGMCVPAPTGQLSGRVVDAQGEPAPGLKMICCTDNMCINAETDDNGVYLFTNVFVEPTKIQILAASETILDILYFQNVVADVTSTLSKDVVLFTTQEPYAPWPVTSGGSVSLAGGLLELTADPDTLKYPLGTQIEELRAQAINVADLPPFDALPWEGSENDSFAFLMDPLHIEASETVQMRVATNGQFNEGTIFQIWAVHSDKATLVDSGEAIVDADGFIVSTDGVSITHLSMLILAPK